MKNIGLILFVTFYGLVLPAVNYSNNRCFVLLNKKNGYNLLFQDTVKKKSQIGMASFYANKFNGRKTASGERFCKDSLTAAHKTLPFGTIIKVTNLATGDTVYARVNDRIPHKKRILDLSPAGAKKLNYYHKGTTKVKVEVIRWP